VDREEKVVERLRPLGWTNAEKTDFDRYTGDEVIQFARASGPFRAGQRAGAAELILARKSPNAKHFAVFARETLALAKGDLIRITAGGKDITGKHKLDNGSQYEIAGFTPSGDLALSNGWVIAKDFGTLAHAYTSTSYASQGRTADRVLIAMGSESKPAINAEQFYVSVSRGRERATVYTSLAPAVLREAIQKRDPRKSATELMGAAGAPKPRRRTFMERMREIYSHLREKARSVAEATLIHERGSYAR
jgi:hypothetical protein